MPDTNGQADGNRDVKSASEKIIRENLAVLDTAFGRTCEKRLSHVFELSRLLLPDALGYGVISDPFREIYGASIYADELPRIKSADVNSVELKNEHAALSCLERAFICRGLADGYMASYPELPLWGIASDEADTSALPADRISYLRNYFADMAYSAFSKKLREPTVVYGQDFVGVCENVYYNRTRYCILPVESSADGRLSGFCSLIDKYELKVAMIANVSSPDASTKFALCQKSLTPLLPDEANYFEFNIVPEREGQLREIITAAAYYGFSPYRINSAPLSYTDVEYSYDVVMKASNLRADALQRALSYLYCYLSLETPQFRMTGIYSLI